MIRRLRSIIAKNWKTLVVVILSFVILWATVQWVLFQGYFLAWTGFGDYTTPNGEYVREKTLWDWMELFIIPIFLAIGAFFLNRSEREIERQRAEEHSKLEREIATDRQQEAALQSYLDRMANLLLNEKLRTSKKAEVRDVARIQTLTVLHGLDDKRKGLLLSFLRESNLISVKKPTINLVHANFGGVYLVGANLKEVNLTETYFEGANLYACDLDASLLTSINLTKANLSEAGLTDADLSNSFMPKANFTEAYLTSTNLANADLTEANFTDAIMDKANLFDSRLCKANFTRASLTETSLRYADLTGADLTNANLYAADLTGVNLTGSNLTGADLRQAQLKRDHETEKFTGKFEGTNLTGAILRGADLTEANLEGADFTKADLTSAKVSAEQLATVKSLRGAIMPDGSKHE